MTVPADVADTCLGRVKPVTILLFPLLMLTSPTASLALTLWPIPHIQTHSQSQGLPCSLPFSCPVAYFFSCCPLQAQLQWLTWGIQGPGVPGGNLQKHLVPFYNLQSNPSDFRCMINRQVETWEEPWG